MANTHLERRILLATIAILAVGTGCASMGAPAPSSTQYFGAARHDDGFGRKISEWQQRADVPQGTTVRASVSATNANFAAFATERRQNIARNLVAWTQKKAATNYREDGNVDHWATLSETLQRGQEDCDGFELLIFNGLRQAGFDTSKVYRAIVVEGSTLQHHMVTLWFEDPSDPWVLDPTGAMTPTLVKMSDAPHWAALRIFNENTQHTVSQARRS